jgi:LysM repeat protein
VIAIFLFSGWQWAGAIDGNQSTEGRPAQQVPPDTQAIVSPSPTPTDMLGAVPTTTIGPPTETHTPEPTALPATETQQPATATVEPTTCGAPEGWVIYIVQVGDTLASIAAERGVTEAQLQAANCLASTEIQVGQQLYVPNVPLVTLPPASTATPRPTIPLPTATPFPTNTRAPSDTPEPTATASDLPTDTPIPSETPLPTSTETPIPSYTPVPTNTPIPLPTDTPANTATSTPITLPPTDTPGP